MSPSPSPSPSTSHSPSHPPSPSPWPSPSHSSQPSTAQPPIHTYHCLCSTLLLATPYLLSTLPARAPPAKDQARILPLPRFRNNTTTDQDDELEPANADADKDVDAAAGTETKKRKDAHTRGYLPSLLLPALRPARKLTLVQREDGYERRRVWRCGRCGLAIGYEVENAESGKGRDGEDEEETVRVMFVLEEGLVLTERMLGGAGKGGGGKAAATAVEGGGKARS